LDRKERIETSGDINQEQTRTLKKSDYEKIRESANVLVQSGYEKRKEDGSAGEIKDDNARLANGKLILSKEGAEQLINEIRRRYTLFA